MYGNNSTQKEEELTFPNVRILDLVKGSIIFEGSLRNVTLILVTLKQPLKIQKR